MARAVAIWVVMLVFAVVNGEIRESLITPRFGEQIGHVLSTLVLSGVVFVTSLATVRWLTSAAGGRLLLVGALWVSLTVSFEFLAGHYLFGNSWQRLLADYNIARGRIWVLVLVTQLISPWVAGRLRGVQR